MDNSFETSSGNKHTSSASVDRASVLSPIAFDRLMDTMARDVQKHMSNVTSTTVSNSNMYKKQPKVKKNHGLYYIIVRELVCNKNL